MPRAWYAYNGGTPQNSAGSWTKIPAPLPGAPRFACVGTANLCAIYAFYATVPSGNNPFSPLSENIQSYITFALVNEVETQPQSGKPYLYKKPQ